jgi:hypothetical protein
MLFAFFPLRSALVCEIFCCSSQQEPLEVHLRPDRHLSRALTLDAAYVELSQCFISFLGGMRCQCKSLMQRDKEYAKPTRELESMGNIFALSPRVGAGANLHPFSFSLSRAHTRSVCSLSSSIYYAKCMQIGLSFILFLSYCVR